jgi:hypothetical protein
MLNDNIRLTVPVREIAFYMQEGLHPIVGPLVNGSMDMHYVEIEQKESTLLLRANRHIGMLEYQKEKAPKAMEKRTGRLVLMNPAYTLQSAFLTAIN